MMYELGKALFGFGELYNKCVKHNIKYPNGAKCPKCEYESSIK